MKKLWRRRLLAVVLVVLMIVTLIPNEFNKAADNNEAENGLELITKEQVTGEDVTTKEDYTTEATIEDITPQGEEAVIGGNIRPVGVYNNAPLGDYIVKIVVKVTENGATKTYNVTPGSPINIDASKNATIKFEYDFSFPDAMTLTDGDTFVLDIDTAYINISGGAQVLEYKDNSGNILAYLEIDASGKAVLRITQKLADRQTDRSGSCYFEYTLDGDAIGNQDNVVIDLTPGVTGGETPMKIIPTENKKIPPTISKGVDYSGSSKGTTIWVITVQPGKNYDTTGLKIEEILPPNTEIISATWNGSNVDMTGGSFTIPTDITTATTLRITTKTDLSKSTGNTEMKNKVVLKKDDEKLDESETTRWYEPSWISKSGSYDETTNSITWKVTVNADELELINARIEDTSTPAGGTITSAKVTYGTDAATDITSSLSFPYSITNTNEKVVLEYTVTYDEGELKGKVKNTAKIINDGVEKKSASAEAGPTPKTYTRVYKSFEGWTNYYTDWVITVNPSGEDTIKYPKVTDILPAGTTIKDMTILVNGFPKTVTISDDGKFTYDFEDEIAEEGSTDTISKEYVIKYRTIIDYNSVEGRNAVENGSANWQNKATLSGDSIDDKTSEATRWGQSVEVLKKTYQGFDYTTNEISWKVVVNKSGGTLTNCKITDSIKPNQELVISSIVVKNENTGADVTDDVKELDMTKTYLSINLKNTTDTYTITYKTKVKDDKMPKDNNVSETYENTVRLEADEFPSGKEDTAYTTPIKGLEGVKKTGIVVNSPDGKTTEYLEWTVDMNKQQQQIPSNTVMTDVIPPGLRLDESSIKLYVCSVNADGSLKVGDQQESVSYTYDDFKNEFKVTLPTTDKSYRLIFRTTVVGNLEKVVNTATFNMDNPGYSDTTTLDNIHSATAGVVIKGGYGTIKVKKTDSVNGDLLDGAVFDVYTKEGSVYTLIGTLDATTDGYTEWTQAVMSTTYYLREKTAPVGYDVYNEYIPVTINTDGEVKVIEVKNDPESEEEIRTLTISKQDLKDSSNLVGVKLAIYDINALTTPIIEWTTTADDKVITLIADENADLKANELKPGTYVLKELIAPKGYAYASSVEFTVNANGTVTWTDNNNVEDGTITMVDERLSLTIEKKDTKGWLISGAELTLKDSKGNTVKKFDSSVIAGETITFTDLVAGETYTVSETKTPEGYKTADDIVFTINRDGSFTVETLTSPSTISGNTVTMVDQDELNKTFTIGKVIAGETTQLAGAEMAIRLKGSNIDLLTFTTTATAKQFYIKEEMNPGAYTLVPGGYVLVEKKAPKGYLKAADIPFKINEDGSITVNNEEVVNVVMEDKPIQDIYISKQDPSKNVAIDIYGTELVGAKLEVTDADNNVIASWTSGATPYKIDGSKFEVGKTYTLTEKEAPSTPVQYRITEPIKFTVDAYGEVHLFDANRSADTAEDKYDESTLTNRIIMYDFEADNHITISKKAVGGVNELQGATLQIQTTSGTKVLEWISGTTAKDIKIAPETNAEKMELAPGTYYLVEITAPYGYLIEERIKFTVNGSGVISSVETESTNGSGLSGNTLVMRDAISTVKISKKILNSGSTELTGASLVLKQGNTVVASWTTTSAMKEFVLGNGAGQLAPGTYTLSESSSPKGYKVAEPITITISDDGVITTKPVASISGNVVTMHDEVAPTLQISKKAIVGSDELPGAVITIKKQDGTIVKTWTSGTEPQSFTIGTHDGELEPGTYTLEETGAPNGYAYAENIAFTVNPDGKITYNLNGVVSSDKTMITMVDGALGNILVNKYIFGGTTNLAGAEFKVYEVVNDVINTSVVIDSWTSTDSAYEILGSKLKANTKYAIVETKAPMGYSIADPVMFNIAKDGSVVFTSKDGTVLKSTKSGSNYTIGIEDKTLVLKVNKVDKDNNTLTGAELGIRVKGTTGTAAIITGTKVTTAGAVITIPTENLRVGVEYELVELKAPTGLAIAQPITFTFDSNGDVKVNGAVVANNTITMVDYETGISFIKVDKDGKPIQGVRLQLTSPDDGDFTPRDWESTDVPYNVIVDDFKEGITYVLSEKISVPGYAYSEDIKFIFRADVSNPTVVITSGEGYNTRVNQVKMTDAAFNVYVGKQNILGTEDLTGAKFKIVMKDDRSVVIDEWTSTAGEQHLVDPTKLMADEDYILIEEEAPDGYTVGEEIVFTVDRDGKVTLHDDNNNGDTEVTEENTVIARDSIISLFVEKRDMQGNLLENAVLELRDSSNNLIETIITTDGTYEVSYANLKGGMTYTLSEKTAPSGYALAEPIVFTIDKNGVITRKDGVEVTDSTIVMFDEEAEVVISKQDQFGAFVEGAELTITSEEDATFVPFTWVTKLVPSNLKFTQFKVGVTYKISEVKAPSGYGYATDIEFKIDAENNIWVDGKIVENNTIVLVDNKVSVQIDKQDADTKASLIGAKLAIIDEATGKEVYSWETTGQMISIPMDKLEVGSADVMKYYILTERKAPEGYNLTSDIRFAISYAGEVYIIGSDGTATLCQDGIIVMYDKATSNNTDEPTTSITDDASSETNTSTDTVSGGSKKTGDHMPVMILSIIFIISIFGFVGMTLYKRRKIK